MQYLDKGSSSTVALTVMEDEFGSVGQCQVLVTHLTYQEAEEAKDKIESVEGVASVVFASSEADSDYYNPVTGDALYKVFLTTSNYDKATYKTLDRIRAELKDYTISLNGGSVESEFLTKALARDMTIILTIVVVVVLGILLLTSSSYVEPLIFLFVAGGAIFINLGTNILLNAIPYIGNSMSFITKSIAAVMQLALSMDYAIILLHTYKEEKEHYDDNKEAMKAALRRAFAPVSSSSITTIAGLVALMFMSFSIGFDVGLVLAKGILLSLLCVFLFMPALLLTFDKLLAKTSHKPIDRIIIGKIKAHHLKRKQQGKKVHSMASFRKKTRIVVPLLAVALFGVAAVFNFTSTYSFTLQASTDANSTINVDDKKITDEFGTQNTLVVLIEKKDRQKSEIKVEEEEIINYLKNYEYNGESDKAKEIENRRLNPYGYRNLLNINKIPFELEIFGGGHYEIRSEVMFGGHFELNITVNLSDIINVKTNNKIKIDTNYLETSIDGFDSFYMTIKPKIKNELSYEQVNALFDFIQSELEKKYSLKSLLGFE